MSKIPRGSNSFGKRVYPIALRKGSILCSHLDPSPTRPGCSLKHRPDGVDGPTFWYEGQMTRSSRPGDAITLWAPRVLQLQWMRAIDSGSGRLYPRTCRGVAFIESASARAATVGRIEHEITSPGLGMNSRARCAFSGGRRPGQAGEGPDKNRHDHCRHGGLQFVKQQIHRPETAATETRSVLLQARPQLRWRISRCGSKESRDNTRGEQSPRWARTEPLGANVVGERDP